MKKPKARRGPHLVTADEAARIRQHAARAAEAAALLADKQESAAASDPQTDPLIANGIRRYQQLQQKFDRELFRLKDIELDPEDIDYIGSVLSELQLLRERLASYGVRVKL